MEKPKKSDNFYIVPFKKLKNTNAWRLTSKLVRLKSGGKCYTCGREVPFKKMHAGHFIEKIGHANIYFELRGLKGQCFFCNRKLHGNKAIFALNLIKEYGESILEELIKLSRISKQWTKAELNQIAEEREKDIKVFEQLEILRDNNKDEF